MGLERLVKEIESEVQKNTSSIIAKARKEAEEIISSAEKQAKEILKKEEQLVEEQARELRKSEKAALNLLLKKAELNAKKEITEQIIELVKQKIVSFNDKKPLLKSLIEKAKKELGNAKFVYSNESEKQLVKEIAPELSFKKTIDCLGGIILENASETVRVNYTYDVLLEKVIEKNISRVSKEVFG
jgi:V/A-type H+-transporting ATPase subunit E